MGIERLAQLCPGVDLGSSQERFLTHYRVLHIGIAVLGLLLVALFSYIRRPDWRDGPVVVICALLAFLGVIARQRQPEVDEPGSGQAL